MCVHTSYMHIFFNLLNKVTVAVNVANYAFTMEALNSNNVQYVKRKTRKQRPPTNHCYGSVGRTLDLRSKHLGFGLRHHRLRSL